MILTLLLIGAQLVIPNHSVGQRVDAVALFSLCIYTEWVWKSASIAGMLHEPCYKKAIIGGLCSIKGHIWDEKTWALSITQRTAHSQCAGNTGSIDVLHPTQISFLSHLQDSKPACGGRTEERIGTFAMYLLNKSPNHTAWYKQSTYFTADTVSENTISRWWALHSCAGLAWQLVKLKATWNIGERCQ